jgi:hypothetical protein
LILWSYGAPKFVAADEQANDRIKQTVLVNGMDKPRNLARNCDDGEPEEWTKPLEPGSFRLNFTLFHPIAGFKDEETPPIDDLISECRIDLQ